MLGNTMFILHYYESVMLTYHVDTEFTEISIELTWESEACGDTRHGDRDQMVQITICWGGEFEGSEFINKLKSCSIKM